MAFEDNCPLNDLSMNFKKEGCRLVQTFRQILIIIIGIIAAIGLITKTFDYMSAFIPPLLSLMMVVWALEEYQKKRIKYAWLLFIFSLFLNNCFKLHNRHWTIEIISLKHIATGINNNIFLFFSFNAFA